MCGIVGWVGWPAEERPLRRAVDALRHRGPDGTGVFLDAAEAVGLGHARLSIIDLDTGAQPLYSEDQDLVLVCNGEIYDFERIREELIQQGHRFSTRSDSEVILHLYQEHGLDFVHHLRGEFAFLLYDRGEQKLLAVRDRFGIKPLFFNMQDGRYVFASEAKAIFATGFAAPKINVNALRDYLSGALPDSIFQGIGVVPPGCVLMVDLRRHSHEVRPYWDLDLPAAPASPEQPIQSVREAVREAGRLRLRADVPVGVYLTGGIDSSIVAATVAQMHTGTLKAFNIAFPEDEAFDEYDLAKRTAEKIGAEFHTVTCDHEALLSNMEDCLWMTEFPFFNFHGVGKFLLSKLTREHVKVVLTGEGSDETFLGYVFFQPGTGSMADQITNRMKAERPPSKRLTRKTIEALGFLPLPEHAVSLSDRRQRLLRRLFHPRHVAAFQEYHPIDRVKERLNGAKTNGLSLARRRQYFWIKSMLAPYLLTMLGDRAELAHSVEGRTPFLDHHLFELARNVPDELKIKDGVEKYILREAFKDDLTPEVYARKKWPYSAPPLWMRRGQSKTLDQLLTRYMSREAIERSGIFNFRTLRALHWLTRIIPVDNAAKRALNSLFIFVLTVQILDHLYVQDFEGAVAQLGEEKARK
ncbi:MAG: asparagine synthase (glutamine-hydrolyzing) [Candidatus Hydrogenedentes bacterium]|nr:asparagine synthase (glutamine-hydrolyzing) [Candidatus Hydrogenedentota bacterium]